jgi:hypothetical protein
MRRSSATQSTVPTDNQLRQIPLALDEKNPNFLGLLERSHSELVATLILSLILIDFNIQLSEETKTLLQLPATHSSVHSKHITVLSRDRGYAEEDSHGY